MSLRRKPYAFTEQGVAMLSSVVNSERAVMVNIEIMRIYVKMREMLAAHKELAERIEQLERGMGKHNKEIEAIFKVLKELIMEPQERKRRKIGFEA